MVPATLLTTHHVLHAASELDVGRCLATGIQRFFSGARTCVLLFWALIVFRAVLDDFGLVILISTRLRGIFMVDLFVGAPWHRVFESRRLDFSLLVTGYFNFSDCLNWRFFFCGSEW